MTMHEVVGRVELAGRTIINLEEDRVRCVKGDAKGQWRHAAKRCSRLMCPFSTPVDMQDRMKQVIQTQDNILNQRILSEVS